MSQLRKARPPLDFDRLDARCLLSGGVTASLSRGTLNIEGTDGPDLILVDVQRLPGRFQNRGVVNVAGVGQFSLARVRRIVVSGHGGDDWIGLSDLGRRPIPARIDGGAGNDLIVTNNARAQIIGGPGSNFINGVWERPPAASPVTVVATTPAPVAPAPVPVATPLAPTPAPSGLSPIEQQIVDQTNQARVGNGLAPLRVNPQLVQAARIQAADMASTGVTAHDLPGTALPTLVDRARYVGYKYGWLGENIAYNYPDAYQVTTAWLASPGHRANILNGDFTEIGPGIAYNSRGEAYYCQTFGSPF